MSVYNALTKQNKWKMEDQRVSCLASTNRSGFVLQQPNESGIRMGEKIEYS